MYIKQIHYIVITLTVILKSAINISTILILASILFLSLFLSTAQTASTTVSVTVTDVNDNSPVFEQPRYSFSVQENAANQYVGSVRAIDIDAQGMNGQVVYSVPFSNG